MPRLNEPHDEDAAIHGKDDASAGLLVVAHSETMHLRRRRHEDASIARSNGPEDSLRSQSSGKHGHTSTTMLPRKTAAPVDATIIGSHGDRSKDFS